MSAIIEVCIHSMHEVKWKSLSRVQLFVTPLTTQSMLLSRPEYWSGYSFPSPGELPNPGIEPRSPTIAGGFFTSWATREAHSTRIKHLIHSWHDGAEKPTVKERKSKPKKVLSSRRWINKQMSKENEGSTRKKAAPPDREERTALPERLPPADTWGREGRLAEDVKIAGVEENRPCG